MSAKLIYPLIMALPEKELELLLDMLKPQMKKFDLNELISDKALKKATKNERLLKLIQTHFTKVKDS